MESLDTASGLLKSERTRRQIMLAAVEVAHSRDLEAVRFSHIAETAGISRATVYNYFDSPDQIFRSVALEFRRGILAFLGRVEAEVQDPVLRIAVALSGILRRVEDNPSWGVFVASWREPEVSMVTQQQVTRWVVDAASDGRVDLDLDWSSEGAFVLRGIANFAMSRHDPPVASKSARYRLITLLLGAIGVERTVAKQISVQAESFEGMGAIFFV